MKDHCKNVNVKTAEDVLKSSEFLETVQYESYDAILFLNHMDVNHTIIHESVAAIRDVKGDTLPIQFIAGHTHYRGLLAIDNYAVSFEPGHYFDTVGWASFDLTGATGGQDQLEQNYRFINANVAEMQEVSGKTTDNFITEKGSALRVQIKEARKRLGLDNVLGCNWKNYYLEKPVTDPDSIYKFYVSELIPYAIFSPPNSHKQWYMEACCGSLRYGFWSGDVTVDDLWTTAPFQNNFVSYGTFSGEVVDQLVQKLNNKTHYVLPLAPKKYKEYQESLPSYVFTAYDKANNYEIIVTEFNEPAITEALTAITGQTATPQAYRTEIDSSSIWSVYVRDNMPCGGDDPMAYGEHDWALQHPVHRTTSLVVTTVIVVCLCGLFCAYRRFTSGALEMQFAKGSMDSGNMWDTGDAYAEFSDGSHHQL